MIHRSSRKKRCHQTFENIFESGELSGDSVCAKFAQTADDWTYQCATKMLDAFIELSRIEVTAKKIVLSETAATAMPA